MENRQKTNYLGIILGVVLNILMIITSIMIYNAYVVNPKINQNTQNIALPANNGIINNNSAASVPAPR